MTKAVRPRKVSRPGCSFPCLYYNNFKIQIIMEQTRNRAAASCACSSLQIYYRQLSVVAVKYNIRIKMTLYMTYLGTCLELDPNNVVKKWKSDSLVEKLLLISIYLSQERPPYSCYTFIFSGSYTESCTGSCTKSFIGQS